MYIFKEGITPMLYNSLHSYYLLSDSSFKEELPKFKRNPHSVPETFNSQSSSQLFSPNEAFFSSTLSSAFVLSSAWGSRYAKLYLILAFSVCVWVWLGSKFSKHKLLFLCRDSLGKGIYASWASKNPCGYSISWCFLVFSPSLFFQFWWKMALVICRRTRVLW